MRRRLSPILILLVLVVVLVFGRRALDPAASVSDDNVFFTDNIRATGASETKTVMERALLHQLDNAQASIDAAIYDFNRDSIRDALVAAHGRGVAIRVVTDDETRLFNDSYSPYYLSLEQAGIPVKDDERENSIMHNKYFVIDGEVVWTGSTNMSDNGFSKNHNNAIVLTGTQVAEVYLNDFDQLWSGDFSVAKTQSSEGPFNNVEAKVQLYFSPKDNALTRIIEEVERAATSIDFAIFFLTDDGLRDAMVAAHERGVIVRGLWDRLGAESPYSGDEAMCAAGIPIRTENTVGKMHNKMMVIDAAGENPRVITGSMNWSNSGARSNDENTVILRDSDVAGRYAVEFKAMWDALGPASECGLGRAMESRPDTRATSGQIGIASIIYNPEGDDVAGEHVVLENVSSSEQALSGWTLSDESENTFVFPSLVLGPGEKVKVWVRTGSDGAGNLYWGRNGAAVWNNSGDSAFLRDSAGSLVASCAYEGGGVEVDCQHAQQ